MPKLNKAFTVEITPEQFLNACSHTELVELDLLLNSPRFQRKMDTDHLYAEDLEEYKKNVENWKRNQRLNG